MRTAPRAFYNEIEPFAVQWLRNLSDAGHIAAGTVEPRSIAELQPADVASFTQCHFFAGIGVWSHALRLAGWPDGTPVWTGSCPCQPFSAAGAGGGFDDPRHLWPRWFDLIRECRPPVVFGEQVEGKAGRAWLDLVSADLEGIGYAFGAAILPAASVGAPHQRHRTFFVAYARGERFDGLRLQLRGRGPRADLSETSGRGEVGELAHADDAGPQGRLAVGRPDQRAPGAGGVAGEAVADAKTEGRGGRTGRGGESGGARSGWAGSGVGGVSRGLADSDLSLTDDGDAQRGGRLLQPAPNATAGFWGNADWIPCADGRLRPVEPGSFPLAHGAASRVGRLRAYGNAIVPQVAAEFIRAAMEVLS